MEDYEHPIASAVKAGLIKWPVVQADLEGEWADTDNRIRLFCGNAKGKLTLFLGSAISSFKPTQLPMWNQFIELIWTSLLKVGLREEREYEDLAMKFKDFYSNVKERVPNYLVTEIVSRRLGLQYLDLLQAFDAQKSDDSNEKSWAINSVHKWAARCLMTNEVAAIVTTNFDNYLEKTLEAANALFYYVTGNAHEDGREISARLPLVSASNKLVLIVNGAKSFAFVRSLMPQFGGGRVTFLFKLHGSCYDPPSCIDTRLQRSQGLPSYSTDVLDILLTRSAWVVAGFSGSDMNDNLDYLRFVSNKNHARVIWLECPDTYRESSLGELIKVLDMDPRSPIGLCLTAGLFIGEKVSVHDETPHFASKVDSWAQLIGCDWCKLVVIDLMILFDNRTGQPPRPDLLQTLNYGEEPAQDWNQLLNRMDLSEQQDQIAPAKTCWKARSLLNKVLEFQEYSNTELRSELCNLLNLCLKDLGAEHVALESAALMSRHPRPHAQAWVLSSLSALAMLCGGQLDAARNSLEISAGLAWLVGDFESYQLVRNTIAKAGSEYPGKATDEPEALTDQLKSLATSDTSKSCVAFTPAMDNVNTKSNRFGVPPAVYIRAILHRSILFADGLFIPGNVITCSTVFVDEILFQGEIDVLDEYLASHLHPLLPESIRHLPNKLTHYMASRHQSYIQEPVDKNHIRQLDEYFSEKKNSDRIAYYDEDVGSKNYGSLFRKQVDSNQSAATVQHLVQLWQHISPSGHWDVHHEDTDRSLTARETAEDLVQVLRGLGEHLPERLYRSSLYRYADLFEASTDSHAFIRDLGRSISERDQSELVAGRNRIVERPWLYGPYCHELFDVPYRCNICFNQASHLDTHTLVFLEDDEVPSWQFMSEIYKTTNTNIQLVVTPPSSSGEHKCSSLLLGTASKSALMQARKSLQHVRAKFAGDLQLSDTEARVIKKVLGNFESRSLTLPEVQLEDLTRIESPAMMECARNLLQRCVFLVRKGLPLDPMYEEAQITVPGLHALRLP